jgi:hypothetical protein
MKDLEVHHMKRRSQLGDDVMHNLITVCVMSVVTENDTDGADRDYVATLPDRTQFPLQSKT